ncbi:hypothetical protein LIER_04540 [Lithospermum erythrorhizon]|uniref:LETM1-like protein n=1 Tax=Lithospermum erythrorhizon TaxID=34254 RepID=A0AAV3NX23_LITER
MISENVSLRPHTLSSRYHKANSYFCFPVFLQLRKYSFLEVCICRSSVPRISVKKVILRRKVFGLDYLICGQCYANKTHLRLCVLNDVRLGFTFGASSFKHNLHMKSRGIQSQVPCAAADDGVTVNGSPQAPASNDVGDIRLKLDQSIQSEEYSTELIQLLHDAARVFELGIRKQSSLLNTTWFSTSWFGVDRNAWVKMLSYQASVFSLLLSANEICSRGDGRDRDINVFVQRSVLRQSAPLENAIRDKLSAEQREVSDWFWSAQVPAVITTFIDYFERDQRYSAATAVLGTGKSLGTGSSSDISLLMLALSCIAAITKLGQTKISCAQFFSIIPDVTGRLMDMLVEFISIQQAYHSVKDIGLRREFLVHFGPRAAKCRIKNDGGIEELMFWVSLVQEQLQQAIDRERIWSRLTTSESIEVLERDLAIFGFFIALGRRTKSYLCANGFDVVDEPLEGFVRFLIGGSVIYYPQLSSISSYQLYVEVVCEELDWLPFYPGSCNDSRARSISGHKSAEASSPNAEAIPVVLDVCSHWIESFIKYSKWLENRSNVKAARYLSKGHKKLKECSKEFGIQTLRSAVNSVALREPDSFDKALESVEEALMRLEVLLQELHVSSTDSGKEQLKAACSDLERIRKLKKEAEFLEVSFRAKAASIQQEGDKGSLSRTSISVQQPYLEEETNSLDEDLDSERSRIPKPRGIWSFLVRRPSRSTERKDKDDLILVESSGRTMQDPESTDIQRFELLRNELKELELRVERSADLCGYEEEESDMKNNPSRLGNKNEGAELVQVQAKENMIGRSLDKLKETTTVWDHVFHHKICFLVQKAPGCLVLIS